MRYARDERLALCALLDAGLGLLGGPLARRTRRLQRRLSDRTPYQNLVEIIRNGPPRLSPFGLPGADERANGVEFFVHHEDVRRAQPGWEPRKLDPGLTEMLWRRLRMARFVLRKAPVGVELARDDRPEPGASATSAGPRVRITAKHRTPVVTVTGSPAELTMWALGRTTAARVRLDGSPAAVDALTAARWRI
jgi:uncharacterized protein (TIGR03085 family)